MQIAKIWKLKLKAEENETTNCFLNQSLDEFEIYKVLICSFLNSLWNCPESILNILMNCDEKIFKSNLAPFIANNFYSNYLSGNYMENNLLYVITMMLKEEIDKIKNIEQVDTFLENTRCGILLEELYKIPDIQIYFKNVIYKTVEKIERTSSFRIIKFNIEERLKELNKLKEKEEKIIDKKDAQNFENTFLNKISCRIFDPSINYSKEEFYDNDNDIFFKKYCGDINITELQIRAEEAKKNNNKDLYDYFIKLIDGIKINKYGKLYSNTLLMENLLETKLATYMLFFYRNDFLDIISFLEQLIEDLMNKINLLPNSIKYICKIISILIKNKFKNITKTEENAFISKFLVDKLLIKFISVPNYNALINDFVISGNTLINIGEMNSILKKLFSGQLFYNNISEGDNTPFNWFFIEKMEDILNFFNKITCVKLPNFIEKFIKNELEDNYSYDYLTENEDFICANINICFTIKNLYYLIDILEKCDNLFKIKNPKINKIERLYKKLKSEEIKNSINEIDEKKLKSNQELAKNKKLENENYYLYNELIIEKKYKNIFSINNKNGNFYIKIKELEQNQKLNENEKNIIKIKNYLCESLGNYRLLNKSDFNIGSTSDTIKMLTEIKDYMSLPNFILNNNTIPSVWYINSILDYLEKIPNEYKKNDYKKLFSELSQNINDSINSLDFETLIIFRNKLKFIDKIYDYYRNMIKLIRDIQINDKVKKIAEEIFIPVKFIFKYDDDEKKFELIKSNKKENLFDENSIYEDEKKNLIYFGTIEAFTRYFPDLNKYQEKNPFDIIKELSINEKINNYLIIIKEKLIKDFQMKENLFESCYSKKFEDYIINKLYKKIYPQKTHDKDNKIFSKTLELSSIEPHIIIHKDYTFDNILPDILDEFSKINKSKTPHKKLNCLKKIMEYIENLIKFNEGKDKEIGAEDITPVLNYVFIKAHPSRMYTDVEFIKLFTENSGLFENSLINFESMNNFMLEYYIAPKEYNQNGENNLLGNELIIN